MPSVFDYAKDKKSKEAPAPSPPLDVSSLKWKKAAEAALSEAPSKKKGRPVPELAARVAAARSASAKASSSASKKGEIEAALGRSLRSLCESSSRFEVDGKGRVKLAKK